MKFNVNTQRLASRMALMALATLGGCAYYPVESSSAVGVTGQTAVYVQPQPVVRYVQPAPVYVSPPPVVVRREVIRTVPVPMRVPIPAATQSRHHEEKARMAHRSEGRDRHEARSERKSPEQKRCQPGQDDCRRR